jgi:hypothetical protein
MLSVWENYCPDQVTFSGAEPSHPTTLLRDRQAFTDAFNAYQTRFGDTNDRDDAEDDDLDNELALYGIINPIVLSLIKSSRSKVECYLSKPLLKKSNKKMYAEF